jgi:hypothetical protein
MTQYPNDYYYSPAQYQALQWQGILDAVIGVAIMVAMAAWAFSLVKKAFKGDEVKFPL